MKDGGFLLKTLSIKLFIFLFWRHLTLCPGASPAAVGRYDVRAVSEGSCHC